MHAIAFRGELLVAAILAALPANAAIVISAKPTKNISCTNGVCTATAKNAVLNVTDLTTMLGSSDVSVVTGKKPMDIEVNAGFSWMATTRLTLDAWHSIAFAKPVTVAGTGALTLTTNDGGTGGEISFAGKANVTFSSLSSSLVVNGASYTLVDDIHTLAGDIASNPSGTFALAADYDASQDGTYSTSPIPTPFTGAFEGLGNTISNLTINDTADHEVALFAEVDAGGTLRDITLWRANVTAGAGGAGVAPLASLNGGTIYRGSASGSVFSAMNSRGGSGGLVASNLGTIADSSAMTEVYSDQSGGLASLNEGLITESFATGSISSAYTAGGIVGLNNSGSVSNSYSLGKTQIGGDGAAGGFVAAAVGTSIIQTSYSVGLVKGGTHQERGGLIGYEQDQTFGDCYWDTTTADVKRGVGNIKGNVHGIQGLTDGQLKSGLPQGFDSTVWAQDSTINSGYPYLRSNPPPK